jgi:hypothetical protein
MNVVMTTLAALPVEPGAMAPCAPLALAPACQAHLTSSFAYFFTDPAPARQSENSQVPFKEVFNKLTK